MKGVKFLGYHSYDVFGMFLNSYKIGIAEPNTMTVEIPGMNGVLDYSEYFGETTYKNRTCEFAFTFDCPRYELNRKYSLLQSQIHGKRGDIVLDDDNTNRYIGRISVGDLVPDGQLGTCTITVDCEPYKYALAEKVISGSGDTSVARVEISITNAGSTTVVPYLTADTAYSLEKVTTSGGNKTYMPLNGGNILPSGTDQIVGTQVQSGETVVLAFRGVSGGMIHVSAKWLEGSL